MKILYHGHCRDGFCAAWVLREKYPDAEFIPVSHNDSPPPEGLEDEDVIIVDEVEIDGIKVAAVNSPVLQSEVGNILVEDGGYPFGIAWMQTEEYQRFSIRSEKGGLNVSELAQKFGGGGHDTSSGFRIQKEAIKKLEPTDD